VCCFIEGIAYAIKFIGSVSMSTSVSENNKLIAKNTAYLYIRMSVTMVVGLYTSRVVLQVLGESDYGLYNVIGGLLTMFTMISSALQVGTQRFLSFALGQKDDERLNRTFSIAFCLHLIVALIIILLAETIGLWFLNNYLNIPKGREVAAFWIYQFSIIGFAFSFVQVPFQSCLIAHERMNMYAYMSIYDVVMKLIMVLLLQTINLDKLIAYGALMFLIQISSVFIYNIYCRRNFSECTYPIVIDKKLTKEMLSYSGWNLLGGAAWVFSGQGVNILLNIFCGTAVNAARGISNTVNSLVTQFVGNVQVAANPQIVKLFASNELENLYRLLIKNSRVVAYLFLLIAIPIYIEIEFILRFWLGDYPQYTDVFIRIMFIELFFKTINQPVLYSIHASGQMKWQNIINSTLLLFIFPFSWVALKLGCIPPVVCVISLLLYMANNIGCLFFSNRYTGLPIKLFVKDVYLNTIFGGIIMFIIPWVVSLQLEEGWRRFFTVSIISFLTSATVIYLYGFTVGMRKVVNEKILLLYKKKK